MNINILDTKHLNITPLTNVDVSVFIIDIVVIIIFNIITIKIALAFNVVGGFGPFAHSRACANPNTRRREHSKLIVLVSWKERRLLLRII
jgi:hypothetical protein